MKALRFCCFFAEKMTGFSVREFNGREGKEQGNRIKNIHHGTKIP